MSEYLIALAGVGVYALGAVVTTFLVSRFGGKNLRENWPDDPPGDGLNGEAIFYIVAWPIFAIGISAGVAAAVVLSPVLVPTVLIGRLLWKRGVAANRFRTGGDA